MDSWNMLDQLVHERMWADPEYRKYQRWKKRQADKRAKAAGITETDTIVEAAMKIIKHETRNRKS